MTIRLNSQGREVKHWQTFLGTLGYSIVADGKFGPATEAATKKFQISKGLRPDGIVAEQTWALVPSSSDENSTTIITESNNRWPKQDYKSMVEFYGPVGENQTSLVLPYKLKLAWDLKTELSRITCHTKIAQSLYTIFEKTLQAYGNENINTLRLNVFGGCLNIRKMRGSATTWSTHSWGTAIDLDPDNNQLRWGRDRASFAKKEYEDFWRIVESEGWVSLGRARGYDFMHAQACIL